MLLLLTDTVVAAWAGPAAVVVRPATSAAARAAAPRTAGRDWRTVRPPTWWVRPVQRLRGAAVTLPYRARDTLTPAACTPVRAATTAFPQPIRQARTDP